MFRAYREYCNPNKARASYDELFSSQKGRLGCNQARVAYRSLNLEFVSWFCGVPYHNHCRIPKRPKSPILYFFTTERMVGLFGGLESRVQGAEEQQYKTCGDQCCLVVEAIFLVLVLGLARALSMYDLPFKVIRMNRSRRLQGKGILGFLVAEFISPKTCTLLVLQWVVLSQKV